MAMNKHGLDSALLHILDTVDFSIRNGLHGRLGGLRPSERRGSSVEWKEYAEYVPGDDIRRIDWNLVARTGRFYTKHFQDEQRLWMHIYLDGSGSMGEHGKNRAALQMAEALGYLSIRRSDIAAYRLLKGNECVRLGENLLTEAAFFKTAVEMEALRFEGDTDLAASIRDDRSPGYQDGISFIISDLMTDSDWKGAVRFLRSRGRDAALIHILAPEEIQPAYSTLSTLYNIENTGDKLQLHIDRTALHAYRQAYEAWIGEIRQFCAKNGVYYLFVGSQEDIAEVFLKRGHRSGLIR